MRVALVVERFEPASGGVENVVWKVAHGLAESGDEVHVLARRGSDSSAVELHRIPVPTFWQPLRVGAFSLRARRESRRAGFDLVHSFCRTRHQDVFHSGGGSHADYMLHAYGRAGAVRRRASPRHALQLHMEERIFRDSRQLIQCVSRMVRDQIARRFAVADERLVVIHNGVDAARFDPDRNRAARPTLRAELGVGDESVWLFVGSGWRRKGLDTALRALAEAADRDAWLWVAGNDDAAPWHRLASQLGVASRVRFLGPRPDIEQVYAAADGLLLPTRYDAFALVVLEACAAGLPVITSASAGAAELLGEAGRVVADAEDAASFADALGRLSDPRLRQRMGELGRKSAAKHDWRTHVEKLRALYARVRR